MKPSFFEGVVFAALASVTGGVLYQGLAPLLSPYLRGSGLILGVSLAYLVYLLRRSDTRVGRIVSVIAWLGIALGALWFRPHLSVLVAIALGFIWLVRSLYFHTRLLTALADLGMTGASYAAGIWAALNTHSVFAVIWCVLLVHATFVALPTLGISGLRTASAPDPFKRAQRTAEVALSALTRSSSTL